MAGSSSAYIQFPTIAAPVTMIGSDDKYSIAGFFGPILSGTYARGTPPSLSEYIKGGGFVPNVAQNSSVPASLPLDMQDLLGAYAEMKITSFPSIYVSTIQEDFTPYKTWSANYSHFLKGTVDLTDHTYKHCEFKWTESTPTFDNIGGQAWSTSDADDTGFSTSQQGHSVGISIQADGDGYLAGDPTYDSFLTLTAKSLIDGTTTVAAVCSVHLDIIGTA